MNTEPDLTWPRARRSQELSQWIDENFLGAAYPDVQRVQLALCSFDVGTSHHSAIAQLVLLNHPVSAMALLRPLFEALILGIWLAYCPSDSDVERFQQGKFEPKLSAMLSALAKHPVLKADPLQAYLESHKKTLHGWTHGGSELLGRLMKLEGDVSEIDIFNVLVTADGFALAIAKFLADGSGKDEFMKGVVARTIALSEESLARGL